MFNNFDDDDEDFLDKILFQNKKYKNTDEQMLKYIEQYKYPKYNFMLKNLPINLFSEYTKPIHKLIKIIYKNITDKELIKKIVDQMIEEFDSNACSAIYNIYCGYIPFSNPDIMRLYMEKLNDPYFNNPKIIKKILNYSEI